MDYRSFAPGASNNNTTPPPVLLPEPPKHLPKLITWIVLLLAAGLAAYVGILYWQDQQLGDDYVPVFTPRIDATADWKTYTNTQYGYEFKYPVSLYDKSDQYAFRLRSTPLNFYDGGGVRPEGIEGIDWVKGYEINVSKQDVKNVSLVSAGEYNVIKLKLPQIDAYAISADVPSSGPDVYIKNPNLPNSFIEVNYNNGMPNAFEVDKIYNQILSTFKFTK